MEKRKNIHLLLTGKPSRLWEDEFGISRYGNESFFYTGCTWKNIYITSDEEIKEGYYLDLTHNIIMKSVFYPSSDKNCKKIIMTTDQDLIKNGVQSINDEFLEWFVKNPSCEEVPIIPKLFGHPYIIWIEGLSFKEEPKQETLKEAAEKYNDDFQIKGGSKAPHIKNVHIMNHFIAGAKWQQERMYSEEDMEKAFTNGLNRSFDSDFDRWFEQFKKKQQ